MKNKKTKKCDLTGIRLPVKEFYVNHNTTDGLHPYSKQADNFRRRLKGTGIGTTQLRNMFNKLKFKTV
tara:strand:- start:757 stop:960 length:204 start_codon:yes stop_codon:yes gene_type:complete